MAQYFHSVKVTNRFLGERDSCETLAQAIFTRSYEVGRSLRLDGCPKKLMIVAPSAYAKVSIFIFKEGRDGSQ